MKNEKPRAEFSRDDYNELREMMKPFSLAKRNGRTVGAFEQAMEAAKIASFNERGDLQIINPLQFTRFNEMRSRMERLDDKKLDEIMKEYPEEKEAWLRKVEEWGQSVKAVLSRAKV